jgi:hypothetical protein
LSVWDQTVREGQQSIVFAVCSRATCTEERQRLERLSRSRQKSFLLKKKKLRQDLEEAIAKVANALDAGEAAAAEGQKALARLEGSCKRLRECMADLVKHVYKLRLISICYSLLHSFVTNHCFIILHSKQFKNKCTTMFNVWVIKNRHNDLHFFFPADPGDQKSTKLIDPTKPHWVADCEPSRGLDST